MSAIKLLTFDLDDTLWEVMPVLIAAEKSVKAWMREHHPTILERFDSDSMMDIRLSLLEEQPQLRHQISQLRVYAVQRAAQRAGYADKEAQSVAQQAFGVFIDARHEVSYFPDALASLETLSAKYSLAAVTNGNANIFQLEAGRYFTSAVTAELVNASKPGPEPFERALVDNQCEAHEAIHIGDHPEHDIAGAAALGMKTVWINTGSKDWQEESAKAKNSTYLPDATITNLADLPAVIARLDKQTQ